jgi:hypothetical protein
MCQEEGLNICLDTRNKRALPLDLDCLKHLSVLKPVYLNESSNKNLVEKKTNKSSKRNLAKK